MTRDALGEVTLVVTTSVDLGDPETEDPYIEFNLDHIEPFGTRKGDPCSCDLCEMWRFPSLPPTGEPRTAWEHLIQDYVDDLPSPLDEVLCDGHVLEELYHSEGTDFIEGCLPKNLFQQMSLSGVPQKVTVVGCMVFTSYSYFGEGDDFDECHFELKSYHLEEIPHEKERLHAN